jgi:hypothetical protein
MSLRGDCRGEHRSVGETPAGKGHATMVLTEPVAEIVLARYAHVRQKVLLTDDEPRQRAFSESLSTARPASTGMVRCGPS